jgi:hypothetical protein
VSVLFEPTLACARAEARAHLSLWISRQLDQHFSLAVSL